MSKNNIIIKKAKIEDAEQMHLIMKNVYNELDDQSLYVCDDLDFVRQHIENEGLAVVTKNENDQIVGCFIVRYPGKSDDNLGRDLELAEDDWSRVVHMESCVVLPQYRGNNLQYKMLKYAENLIDTSKKNIFLATVSPENPSSYKSFEKNGYSLEMTKKKYGGLMRRIYKKEVD